MPGSFTPVMHSRFNSPAMVRMPSRIWSGFARGTWLATSAIAVSFRTPVGLPAASRSITPPGGSFVSRVMPAISSATVFATP